MKLTAEDYCKIAELIEEGESLVEYEKDGETLSFVYELCVDGYTEDDYYNGTGAFIATDVELFISNVECWDADGETVEVLFDEDEVSKEVCVMVA